jgi:hypothetical protein
MGEDLEQLKQRIPLLESCNGTTGEGIGSVPALSSRDSVLCMRTVIPPSTSTSEKTCSTVTAAGVVAT